MFSMRTEILLLCSLLHPDLPPSKASSTLGAAEILWRPWRREGTHLQTWVLQEVRGKSPFIHALQEEVSEQVSNNGNY